MSELSPQRARPFKLSEIRKATKLFDESLVIGTGRCGKVYKAQVSNGERVVLAAIKRLNSWSKGGAPKSCPWPDVERISRLRHCNVVSLIGFCNHVKQVRKWRCLKLVSTYEEEAILVYEYISNGTLMDHLHVLRTPLSWTQRLNICLDVARGLRYLHGTESGGVVHGDLKSSNILLTESWAAKVSDFWLLKLCRRESPCDWLVFPLANFGYWDEWSIACGELSMKSDVYSFGRVLLEVLCRKPAMVEIRVGVCTCLVTWVHDSVRERNLEDIIDPDIRNEITTQCLKDFFGIAEVCLQENPKDRPDIAEVVDSLEALQDGRKIYGLSISTRIMSEPSTPQFTLSEIEKATGGFDESLVIATGCGGGKVYKGQVLNGSGVVVLASIKRLNCDSSLPKCCSKLYRGDFTKRLRDPTVGPWPWPEVERISPLRHCNIVSLIGYCNHVKVDEKEAILVYEYIPNGTLHDHLHVLRTPLSWPQRLKICIGVARGLRYLHATETGVIHGNLRSSNVLFTETWEPKVSAFGLSKIGRKGDLPDWVVFPCGMMAYWDPVSIISVSLTRKSDVYTFGVLLLEILFRRREMDQPRHSESAGLVNWVQANLKERNPEDVIDQVLRSEISPNCLHDFLRIVDRCLHKIQAQRPDMAEVVDSLEALQNDPLQSASDSHSGERIMSPGEFTLCEILKATRGFDESLVIATGCGGGKVYKAQVFNGSGVVLASIKRLNCDSSLPDCCIKAYSGDYPKRLRDPTVGPWPWPEVERISPLRHCNIVSLIGYCNHVKVDEKEAILVYEYIPNGTLHDHLHVLRTPLLWPQRLKICIGVARGLRYLHATETGVIHGNVRSSNVLFTETWEPKVQPLGCPK